MIRFIKPYRHLLAILTVAGQGLMYMFISSLARENSMSTILAIDDRIPYLSWFVVFYVAWMFFLYVAFLYLGLTNRSLYWRTIIAYNVAVSISNLIFILFPTSLPRPEISGNDIFNVLVLLVYSHDQPVNCFPSIHCLTTYLLFITMTRHRLFSAGVQILLSAFLWSIIASTVFIKQHALADVIGGILLAEMAYRVVHYILDKQQKAPITKPNDSSVTLNG